MQRPLPFEHLRTIDLTIEQIYVGGKAGNASDDPLAVLLPVGNQGGFRYAGSPRRGTVKLVVLYTSGHNEDWPDCLDPATGTFSYYGDNRVPGKLLHDTSRQGNVILRDIFAAAQSGADGRRQVPPFLLFEKTVNEARAVQFRGLLVPGSPLIADEAQLVAIWRSKAGARFQNYRATFTVLDVSTVTREWLNSVLNGEPDRNAPASWSSWVETGSYMPLLAQPTTTHRTKAAQTPTSAKDVAMLARIHQHFADRPTAFEQCAADIFKISAPAVRGIEVTRPSRDGGRDAIGKYAIGPDADPVSLNFALEAKCYATSNSVGVREVARLVSRLKHREFGVLVTTSYVDQQAYREIREDGHPIVILAGVDLLAILKQDGIGSIQALGTWLDARYPEQEPLVR